MKKAPRTVLALAGLVGSTALLAGCSEMEDLGLANTCGQPVTVGFGGSEDAPQDEWYVLDSAEKLEAHLGLAAP